jgi:hypothetical protein
MTLTQLKGLFKNVNNLLFGKFARIWLTTNFTSSTHVLKFNQF